VLHIRVKRPPTHGPCEDFRTIGNVIEIEMPCEVSAYLHVRSSLVYV
jgi:hypothetical protein